MFCIYNNALSELIGFRIDTYNRAMSMEHSLKNGSYFYIINRGISTQSPLCLTYNSDSQTPSLYFQPLDQTSHDQIWMIEEVKSNCYEIVHAYSTLALTANEEKTWMQTSLKSSQQLFFVQKSDPKNNPYQHWIKQSKLSDKYFQYETKLKCTLSNPQASKCRWEFKRITAKNEILNSSLIQFAYSGLYMELPGSSMNEGVEIRQFPLSGRCNQRWKLVKSEQGDGYLIVSTRSKMCLSVKNGKAKNRAHVVQEKQNQSLAQKWRLIHQGLSLYIIGSMLKSKLYLGTENNSMNSGAEVVLTNKEQYAFWRIIGSFEAAKQNQMI